MRIAASEAKIFACAASPGSGNALPFGPREAAAAYSISREAVSCVCMSASIHCSPWNSPIGRPNCSRDLAQATACSSAPAAIPIATVPAPTRWLL